jgi:hypothetical protein
MMLDLALTYPEYRDTAQDVELIETTADAYYGKGYQTSRTACPRSPTPAPTSAGNREST